MVSYTPEEGSAQFQQMLSAMVNAFSLMAPNAPVRPVRQNIQDLSTLLLTNVPYGPVDPDDLLQQVVEVQSVPTADPLYWYFGGKAYQIDRAVRIPYKYRYTDYGGEVRPASVFVGYEHRGGTSLDGSPQNGTGLLANLPENIKALYGVQLYNSTSSTVGPIKDYNHFILEKMAPYAIELGDLQYYAGIAKDNDADHPFRDMWQDITSNQAKYDQIMHYPFGSRVYPITKVIRIPYKNTDGSLFVVYQGGGGQ